MSARSDMRSWSVDSDDVGIETLQLVDRLKGALFGRESSPPCVGRFVIRGLLGQGATGTVYAADDPLLDRRVAVKLLRKGLLAGPDARERMLHEAKQLARLNHPNILVIHDVGVLGGQVFIATELAEGGTLAQWCARDELQNAGRTAAIVELALQAARGLAAAHAEGLLHRDVKPGNMLIGRDGRLRIADFGLASDASDDESSGDTHAVGTPAYMAPEQRAGHATHASDQYAWAVSVHEILTGVRPACGPLPRDARVPGWLRRVLERALDARPERRWPDMDAIVQAIESGRGRRRRRIVAGFASVCAIAAIVPWLRASDAACSGGDTEMAATWNDDARTRIVAALAGVSAFHRDDTAPRVIAALDLRADAWIAAHREACAATHVRHEQSDARLDQRMSCLAERRQRLGATVRLLVDADAELAERAIELVEAMPSVEACTDASYVAGFSRTPALVDALARVDALGAAGRYAEARVAAEELVRDAAEDPSLLARALARRGGLEADLAEHDAAVATLEQALLGAQRVDDDETVADAAADLCAVEGLVRERPDEGIRWCELARATAAGLGEPGRLRGAKILATIGSIREHQARLDDAVAAFDEAMAELRALGADDGVDAAQILASRAATATKASDFDGAVAIGREALAIFERVLGPDHPRVARTIANLAIALVLSGDDDGARAMMERALAIRERSLGPDHPDVAESLVALAVLDNSARRFDDAMAKLERALAIVEARLGREHPRVATCLEAIGKTQQDLGQYAEAVASYERARAIVVATRGPDDPAVALRESNIAIAMLRAGDPASAVTKLDHALAILERTDVPSSSAIALALTTRGDAHAALGARSEAIADLERALALREHIAAPPDILAATRASLARTIWATDRARAHRLAELALAGYDAVGASGPARDELAAWLAEHPILEPDVASPRRIASTTDRARKSAGGRDQN